MSTQGAQKLVVPFKRQLDDGDLRTMNLPPAFWRASFSGVSPGDHRDEFVAYMRDFKKHMRSGVGLYLCGPTGVGKTALAAFVLKYARERGWRGYFGRASALIGDFEGKTIFRDRQTVKERCYTVDLLCIDDLGAEQASFAYKESVVWEDLIRHRADNMLPTILTTNLHADKFGERYPNGLTLRDVMRSCMKSIDFRGDSLRMTAE